MKALYPLYFALFSVQLVSQQVILPDTYGDELAEKLRQEYKPSVVPDYTRAREILYTKIDNHNDTVYTIYSNHSRYLPPDEIYPIGYLANDGNANGINAEHIYPRSKGASQQNGNAFSDLYNLYPARWAVNEARSNFPLVDIPDENTDFWFYLLTRQSDLSQIPTDQLNLYSEVDIYPDNMGYFEPREAVKGDIARSIFYFYTMYREEAIAADPEFFGLMKESLCLWHHSDSIDQKELVRTYEIAQYQQGKLNPFVMDCTLARRLYCEDLPPCINLLTHTDDIELNEDIWFTISPNPARDNIEIKLSKNANANRIIVYNLLGEQKLQVFITNNASTSLHIGGLNPGLYLVVLFNEFQAVSTDILVKH